MGGQAFQAFLRESRAAIFASALFSGVINLLALTGSLFMLQVYDRVLTSRSVPTLVALLGLVILLYAIQAALEAVRLRLFARLGRSLDEKLSVPALRASLMPPPGVIINGPQADPLRDVDAVRLFMTGQGPVALFDLPWAPLYILICFLFHPYLGWFTLGGALLVTMLALWSEVRARRHSIRVTETALKRQVMIDDGRRNAEILPTMDLASRIETLFGQRNVEFGRAQQVAADSAAGISSVVRGLRMLLQSVILALAAYLAIRQEISGGTIVAASILASRALAPIDLAVNQWRSFVAARLALGRLRHLAGVAGEVHAPETALPAPRKALSVQDVYVAQPGGSRPLVGPVNFAAAAGEGIGIIGPSGSGKTTLARALVGIWPVMRGKVALDGAPLGQYSAAALGQSVAYLPQEVYLFDGTVAANIARFAPDATDAAVVAAARLAGVHDLIIRLPRGYDTVIGDAGVKLSSGQRQRIGLARALYGDPFVVVLDEPYSNLDGEGDAALNQALAGIKRRGGIFVLIAHRRSAIGQVDRLLTIQDGTQTSFGPRDEVLAKLTSRVRAAGQAAQAPASAPAALKVVSDERG